MTTQKVLYIEDKRLRQKANKVRDFSPALQTLAQDMLETMRCYEGVGLAGPQIGVMQRIFVAEILAPQQDEAAQPPSSVNYVLINPKIIRTSKNLIEGKEGCLSIPHWAGLVDRPAWVEVTAQDVTGQPFKLRADDLLARIFQHEIDHLNGVLYIDYITEPKKLWRTDAETGSDGSKNKIL